MNIRRIKQLALLIPAAGLIGFEVFRHTVLHPLDYHPEPHLQEHFLSAAALFVGVVAFTFAIFSLLERQHDQLAALNEAGITVTGELAPDRVLHHVAELARTVARVPHATVGVDADPRRGVSSGDRPPGGRTLELPIVVRGRRLGELVLTASPRRRFRTSDRAALETFASQAGTALENARLYEEVRELGALRERARIGMDLHDGVIQHLYALGLTLEDTADLVTEDPSEAARSLLGVQRSVREVIGDVRSYVYELQDGDASVDVGEILPGLAAEFEDHLQSITVDLQGEAVRLPARIAGNVVQVIREGLANAMRHAGATSVRVRCRREGSVASLTVEDDGCGFDPARSSSGLGMEDMRRRARWSGGTLELRSRPGSGTVVRLLLPVPPTTSEAGP
jgi:signal transduction histidine kinase